MRAIIIATLLGLLASTAAAETRLLRFPDLYGDTVVFTYAGDLWLANTDGTNVRRLTSHPGQELFGRFSPDGQHIAFTGQYDGGEQVYVVPVTGGEPTRLTWYPSEGPLPPPVLQVSASQIGLLMKLFETSVQDGLGVPASKL